MIVSASITAQNNFTDWLEFDNARRFFNVSVSGTFSATVTVQRSYDGGSTPLDVKEYTAPAEEIGEHVETIVLYRIGVKTGDFTSGTVEVRLGY